MRFSDLHRSTALATSLDRTTQATTGVHCFVLVPASPRGYILRHPGGFIHLKRAKRGHIAGLPCTPLHVDSTILHGIQPSKQARSLLTMIRPRHCAGWMQQEMKVSPARKGGSRPDAATGWSTPTMNNSLAPPKHTSLQKKLSRVPHHSS